MHCEIFAVGDRKAFRWKWRHVAANGRTEESSEAYVLFYECVAAARKSGYEPALKGVAPKQ
jgi:hypothetical protein